MRSVNGWATMVLGLATAIVVGADGSSAWRLIRVLSVAAVTAAALWAYRYAHRAGADAGAVVLGLVGIIIGAGIGVPHLLKDAVTLPAIAALAALAAGLVLLVTGAAALLRAVRGWWRLAAIPVALAIGQFVLLPGSFAVYATNVPPTAIGDDNPARHGLSYEDVTVVSGDGVALSGWYVPSTNQAAVVLLHGAGSTRADVLEQAGVLARRGYGVLLLDTRGHGRSGGDAMDWGWYGTDDITAAVSYLRVRSDVDPDRIGAVGMSMGGEQAITAAATDERIRAVVAEGVGVRCYADLAAFPRNFTGLVVRGEGLVMFPLADLLSGARPPIGLAEAVRSVAPRRVLLIAGAGETATNAHYRAASPATVDLWELPDTGHTRGLAEHPAQWEANVVGFLDGALGA